MQFGLLGPLEMVDDRGSAVALGGPQQRLVLAMLLASHERGVHIRETLRRQLGEIPAPFEALLAIDDGRAVGFALFFHTYSTWRGKRTKSGAPTRSSRTRI